MAGVEAVADEVAVGGRLGGGTSEFGAKECARQDGAPDDDRAPSIREVLDAQTSECRPPRKPSVPSLHEVRRILAGYRRDGTGTRARPRGRLPRPRAGLIGPDARGPDARLSSRRTSSPVDSSSTSGRNSTAPDYLEPARSRGARRSDDHQTGKPDARLLGGAGQCPQARRVAELQPRQIDHHAQGRSSSACSSLAQSAGALERSRSPATSSHGRRRRDAPRSRGSRHRSGSMLPPRRTATHQACPGLLCRARVTAPVSAITGGRGRADSG